MKSLNWTHLATGILLTALALPTLTDHRRPGLCLVSRWCDVPRGV